MSQDGYGVELSLAPASELGLGALSGAVRNLGYRLDLSGPVATHVDLEQNLWRGSTIIVAHHVFERAAFRHEPSQPATAPLGELVGSIPVPVGAQSGDHLEVLATVQLPNGWAHPASGPPTVRIALATEPSGTWLASPMPTAPLASPHPSAPSVALAASTRPGEPASSPTPWPKLARPLGQQQAVQKAAAVLPLDLYARAQVHRTLDGDTWHVSFDDLHARLTDLPWAPETTPPPNRPRPTAAIRAVQVQVDRDTGQVLQAEAIADPHGPPEDPQPRLPDYGAVHALPAGRVVVLLPPGSAFRTLAPSMSSAPLAGTTPFIRPVGPAELGAWGVQVVQTSAALRQAAEAGAGVLWIHRGALGSVDATWARALAAEGRAIGVVDGGMGDLVRSFGLGRDEAGWLGTETGRPVFALVREYHCVTGARTGGGQSSEWLSLGFWLAVSAGALADPCAQS